MSKAVVHGNTVYLAGQVADKTVGKSVAEQTQEIIGIIDSLLAEAGSDKTKILSATIYLSEITTFQEMNSVWDKWVVLGHTPARATVEARLVTPDYKVEIAVIAAV
jgi:enamine deaminase RidA (YjgF/YER057c/UK114 family)